jgi:hypothetical protein
MKPISFTLLTVLLLAPLVAFSAADGLVVYPPVPGLAASAHYQVRVRPASNGSEWWSAFAWETVCKTIEKTTDAYFNNLAGWTHIYVSFEIARTAQLPPGQWNADDGTRITGPLQRTFDIPLGRLLYFERQQRP